MRIGVFPMIGLLLPLGAVAAAGAAPAPLSIIGQWRGSYECSQGKTALTLTVSDAGSGRLTARFNFGPLPENPLVPTGAFVMEGSLNAKTRRVMFHAGKWISQPTGYFTVDLDGYLSASATRITGIVPAAGCSVFDLVRGEALVG
jgi:hypothetical protein